MAGIQATGAGSGLDVRGLVDNLMTVEKQPLAKLDKKEAAVQVKISAYGAFKGAASALRASLSGLQSAGSYTAMSASVAEASVATASASASADVGTHSLEVTTLAAAQRLKSGTFQSVTDTVGSGTLSIQYGSFAAGTFTQNGSTPTHNITIDATNNTLAGVRDAINKANVGVNASIVNDGSGFRLVVASKNTGTTNSLKLSVTDTDGNNTNTAGLSQLAFDPAAGVGAGQNMSEVAAAKDAEFLLDGLLIKKQSNTVSDALSGVTLNLTKTNAGTPTTFTIAKDSKAIKTAIEGFVKAYNELDTTVDKLTGYNAATKVAGDLSGDAAIRQASGRIRDALSQVVSTTPGGYNALAQIGITLSRDGQLAVDNTKLTAALDKDPTAVQGLFSTAARTDDPLVNFVKAGDNTRPGSFALNVSQLATQGKAVGGASAGLTIDNTNDTLELNVNGTATSIKLSQRTYSNAAALASELQSQVNGAAALVTAGSRVTVSENAGVLSITSDKYGSASKVQLSGGNGLAGLFGTVNSTNGVDVGGSLGLGGTTGNGQELTSSSGLTVKVTGGNTGERGNVTFMRGIASQLDKLIGDALDSKGTVPARIESLNQQVKDIENKRTFIEQQLELKEARYLKQFNSLDGLLTNMQSTMSYLSQQLSALNNSTK